VHISIVVILSNKTCQLPITVTMDDYYAPIPTPGSDRDCDDRFYAILGGGVKFSLLEGFLDLKLPELLGKSTKPYTAEEICTKLS
jgi:hypothetical protein